MSSSSLHFKLTSPGGELRRLTLPNEPTWLSLTTRIEELFGIPTQKVAVAYVDNDGDEVTMSSQGELTDYFANCHKAGEPVKFDIVELNSHRSTRSEAMLVDDDIFNGARTGLGTMGPTTIFEIDDTDWQGIPRMPDIYGMHEDIESRGTGEPHAYVETVSDDTEHRSIRSARRTEENSLSSHHSLSSSKKQESRTTQDKGKGKTASDKSTLQTHSLSSVSVIDDDIPDKPPLHAYDHSEAAISPRVSARTPRIGAENLPRPGPARYSAFGGQAESTSYSAGGGRARSTTSPLTRESVKPLPQTPTTQPASSFRPIASNASSTPKRSAAGIPQVFTPRAESVPLAQNNVSEQAERPQQGPRRGPSFVEDVANLVDALTNAFAAHPELSEGLRNIVQNSVRGVYLEAERERVAQAADSVRRAAEETSERISRAIDEVTPAEQEAGRRIAQSLRGVFQVIGDLSSSISNLSGAPPTNGAAGQDGVRSLPVGPPPPFPPFQVLAPPMVPIYAPFPPPHPSQLYSAAEGPHPMPPPPPPVMSQPSVEGENVPYLVYPWIAGGQSSQLQRSNTWGGTERRPQAPPMGYPYDSSSGEHDRADAHELKAQLEAAKAVYKAEKERYQREKEDRRRLRKEAAEKRAEAGLARGYEEQVVARISLPSPNKAGPSRRAPFAEIYRPAEPSHAPPPPPPPKASEGYSEVEDRILMKLKEMGLSPKTHPELRTLVHDELRSNPSDIPEETIVESIVNAMHIRGSPSPRPIGPFGF